MSDKEMIQLDDVQDDYNYARSKYYSLAQKGEEAIDIMLDFARESESPRAMEVLSNMLKQNAEITDRLLDLQKKKRELETQPDANGNKPSLTQNNVYIGSTTDLQRMLHGQMNAEGNVIESDQPD